MKYYFVIAKSFVYVNLNFENVNMYNSIETKLTLLDTKSSDFSELTK